MTHQFTNGDICHVIGSRWPWECKMIFVGIDPTDPVCGFFMTGTDEFDLYEMSNIAPGEAHDVNPPPAIIRGGHRYVLAPEEGQS